MCKESKNDRHFVTTLNAQPHQNLNTRQLNSTVITISLSMSTSRMNLEFTRVLTVMPGCSFLLLSIRAAFSSTQCQPHTMDLVKKCPSDLSGSALSMRWSTNYVSPHSYDC